MSRFISFLRRMILLAAGLSATPFAHRPLHAADSAAELLPSDPSMWLNSPPLTAEALKGKGVVLWFFEETCPQCRRKWPGIYDVAKKYEGQPVVFIAVNSGNAPAAVQQYAREVKLTWPIIVDPSRQFEKLWMDQEISLQNIHQCELLLPSGKKAQGRWNDLDGSVQKALSGAAWKIDPKTIPAAFLPTWQQIELGNYPAAAGMLKKGLATKNPEVKEAATRINAFVQGQISSAVDAAAKARQEGDPWRAFQTYSSLTTTFAGYDLPASIATAQKELASDAQVKKQLEAAKTLDGIRKAMATARTDAGVKRIVTRLEQLSAQYPGTDAARDAKQMLEQAKNQP